MPAREVLACVKGQYEYLFDVLMRISGFAYLSVDFEL